MNSFVELSNLVRLMQLKKFSKVVIKRLNLEAILIKYCCVKEKQN